MLSAFRVVGVDMRAPETSLPIQFVKMDLGPESSCLEFLQLIAIHQQGVDPRRLQFGTSQVPAAEYVARFKLMDCQVFVLVVIELVRTHGGIGADEESKRSRPMRSIPWFEPSTEQ